MIAWIAFGSSFMWLCWLVLITPIVYVCVYVCVYVVAGVLIVYQSMSVVISIANTGLLCQIFSLDISAFRRFTFQRVWHVLLQKLSFFSLLWTNHVSFSLTPTGAPAGAVFMFHGWSLSPCSANGQSCQALPGWTDIWSIHQALWRMVEALFERKLV